MPTICLAVGTLRFAHPTFLAPQMTGESGVKRHPHDDGWGGSAIAHHLLSRFAPPFRSRLICLKCPVVLRKIFRLTRRANQMH